MLHIALTDLPGDVDLGLVRDSVTGPSGMQKTQGAVRLLIRGNLAGFST